MRMNKTNTSGYLGVSYYKSSKKWRARITIDKEQIYIGYFSSSKVAAIAYDRRAIKHYGKNAITNASMGLI